MVTSEDRSTGLTRPADGRTGRGRWRTIAAAVAAGAVLLSAGCSGDKSPSWQGGSSGDGGSASAPAGTPESPKPPESTVAVTTPEAGASGVEALTQVKYSTEDPENTTVTVKDSDGDSVDGTLDKDSKVWTPEKALSWGKKYTVTVEGTASGDKVGTTTSTFTVMKKPSKLVRVSSFLGDGQTVGVGMPLIIRFGRSVPQKYRDDVQRRMTVTATPAQEGIWHWTSPTEVHYRPKVYWKANTKISYKVRLAAAPLLGFDSERIQEFEARGVPVDSYGVGSALIRGENDFTGDIVLTDGKPSAKVGRELRSNDRLELVL